MTRLSLSAATALLMVSAASAAVLVLGTPVTGSPHGGVAGLLGADLGSQPGARSNTTVLLDVGVGMDSIEFVAADFSIQLYICSDGLLRQARPMFSTAMPL